PAVADAELADRDRDAEPLLPARLHDQPVPVLLDRGLLDHALVAFEGDDRLAAVDRLDVDVAARYLDLELERLGGEETVLGHRQAAFGVAVAGAGRAIERSRALPPRGAARACFGAGSETPDGSSYTQRGLLLRDGGWRNMC